MPIAGFQRHPKLQRSCYVLSVLQALLRVPAIASWLGFHCQSCIVEDASNDLSRVCCACALWRSRKALGKRVVPELVLRRDLAGKCFHDLNQHDVVAFISGLLEALRDAEREVSRCAPLPPDLKFSSMVCTHVDRIFSFVCEERSQCVACGHIIVEFYVDSILRLPLVHLEGEGPSITDLYVQTCQLSSLGRPGSDRECSGACGCRTLHLIQVRIATTPNVLLVHLERVGPQGKILRHPVRVEEELNLPGLDPLELSSVIYIEGATLPTSHYLCVSRGPDGNFWNFDDQRPAFRIASSLASIRQASAEFLIYTQP